MGSESGQQLLFLHQHFFPVVGLYLGVRLFRWAAGHPHPGRAVLGGAALQDLSAAPRLYFAADSRLSEIRPAGRHRPRVATGRFADSGHVPFAGFRAGCVESVHSFGQPAGLVGIGPLLLLSRVPGFLPTHQEPAAAPVKHVGIAVVGIVLGLSGCVHAAGLGQRPARGNALRPAAPQPAAAPARVPDRGADGPHFHAAMRRKHHRLP